MRQFALTLSAVLATVCYEAVRTNHEHYRAFLLVLVVSVAAHVALVLTHGPEK